MKTMSKQLLIPSKDLSKKINQFVEKVSQNEAALNEFVDNPFQVLAQALPNEMGDMTKAEISDSNKLLFSVLANREFTNWLVDYQKNIENEMSKPENVKKTVGAVFNRDKIYEDLSSAIMKYGDEKILSIILQGSGSDLAGSAYNKGLDGLPCGTPWPRAHGFIIGTDITFTDIVTVIQSIRVVAERIAKKATLETATRITKKL